ncbi:hypothetical protein N9A74_07660 [Akkermansiaceae bacterium]|nr:hypothetical protein [Akkermansiaceae bacterium]
MGEVIGLRPEGQRDEFSHWKRHLNGTRWVATDIKRTAALALGMLTQASSG